MSKSRRIDAWKLWTLNFEVIMSVMAEVAPLVRALDLEMKEFFLLAKLDAFPYPADLARELIMPKPTVTVLVKRLEAAAFLRRDSEPGDLRRFRLTLLPAGRRAMESARDILDEVYQKRVARLTRAQVDELAKLLERLA